MPVRGATVYRPRLVPRFSAGSGSGGSGTGPGPNAPGSGYTLWWEDPFDVQPPVYPGADSNYGGLQRLAAGGGAPNDLIVIVNDATALTPNQNVLRYPFPDAADCVGGTFNYSGGAPNRVGTTVNMPANTGYLYFRIRIRFSANWVKGDGGTRGPKFTFLRDGVNNHYVGFDGNFGDIYTMRHIIGTQGNQTVTWYDNDGGTPRCPITPGNWYDCEWLIEANTPGTANGRGRVWVNNVLSIDTNVYPATQFSGLVSPAWFNSGQTAGWTGFYWDSTWGSNAPSATQWYDLDHMYVSYK